MSKETPPLNFGSLFDTPDKKAQAVSALTEMSQTVGWKIMQEVIGQNLQHHRTQLEDGRFEDLREVDDLQTIIGVFKWLLVMPQDIVAHCADGNGAPTVISGDPYDKLVIPEAEQEQKEQPTEQPKP